MCLSVGSTSPSVQSVGYAVLFPPLAWIRDLWLGDRLIPLTRQGLSPASFFTVLVKTREALSDILPHEVGEMAGRPEGAASSHHSRIRAPRCELAKAPCSSRAPRVPPPLRRGDRKWVPCRFANRGLRLSGRSRGEGRSSSRLMSFHPLLFLGFGAFRPPQRRIPRILLDYSNVVCIFITKSFSTKH